jgi:hypothetical protein
MFTAAALTLAKKREYPKCPGTDSQTKRALSVQWSIIQLEGEIILICASTWTNCVDIKPVTKMLIYNAFI